MIALNLFGWQAKNLPATATAMGCNEDKYLFLF
jgi:hypothetical protein